MKLLFLFLALVQYCNCKRTARAVLFSNPTTTSDPRTVWGSVDFSQEGADSPLQIKIQITSADGLTDGSHGFHIHELGNIYTGCGDAGGHYNPFGKAHGGINDTVRHVGDFGNIPIKSNAYSGSFTDKIATLYGQYTIVGRAVVLHNGEDDLGKGTGEKAGESKKTGNAGSRVACGVIAVNSKGFDNAANSRITTSNSILIALTLGIYYILSRYN